MVQTARLQIRFTILLTGKDLLLRDAQLCAGVFCFALTGSADDQFQALFLLCLLQNAVAFSAICTQFRQLCSVVLSAACTQFCRQCAFVHDHAACCALDHSIANRCHLPLDLRQSPPVRFRHPIIVHRVAVNAVRDSDEIFNLSRKGCKVRRDRRCSIRIVDKLSLPEHGIGQHRCSAVHQIGSVRIRHYAPRRIRQSAGALDGLKSHPAPVQDMPPDPPLVLLVSGYHCGYIIF